MTSLVSVVFLLAGGTAFAQAPPTTTTSPAQITHDPNAPGRTRSIVSRDSRERLGLKKKTWTGVVEPSVYTKLDGLNRAAVRLKTEAGASDEAFEALSGMHFKGTVYVQVQLKPIAKNKDVLSAMNSSQFHVWHLFETSTGFVGFATKEALDALAKHPDVVGVCLDDEPLSEGPVKMVLKDDLPPPKANDASAEQPGVKEGRVEPEVYRAFDVVDRAFVWVILRGDGLPAVDDTLEKNELLSQAEKRLRDRVLETMTADDFFMRTGEGLGAGFLGFVTRDGLQKLLKHPDVLQVRFNSKKN